MFSDYSVGIAVNLKHCMITTKEKFKPDLLFVIPDTWKALVGGSHVQI